MHWWHDTPEGTMGVRTRCSDDLLWLPWALCDYAERTGDTSILYETAPFLDSEPLKQNEHDRYEKSPFSEEKGTILEHSKRAAECFLTRGTGSHGLALMLGGDWNDGMDGVGRQGRGESVWLTLFGSITLRKLAKLCQKSEKTELKSLRNPPTPSSAPPRTPGPARGICAAGTTTGPPWAARRGRTGKMSVRSTPCHSPSPSSPGRTAPESGRD